MLVVSQPRIVHGIRMEDIAIVPA